MATDSVFTTTLATDSTFINTLSQDTTFINNLQANEVDGDTTNEIQFLSTSNDTLYLSDGNSVYLGAISSDNDQDSTNELNTAFAVVNDSLAITDAGGTRLVALSEIQVDTTSLSARIDSVLAQDDDRDSTNEIQFLSTSNDTLYLSDGNSVYLGAISSDNDQDSTNELNTVFEILNDSLFITDAGGTLGVPLDSIVNEPWYTVGTTEGHTTNTGDMFYMGNIGVGTVAPDTKLHVEGKAKITSMDAGSTSDEVVVVDTDGVLKKVAQTHKIQTLTSTGSVDADTDVLLVTPGANMTVTIPAIGTGTGQFPEGYELKIKRTSAAGNTITLSPTSSTIDGQATRTLNIGYQSMTLVATSSGWFIID